MGDMGEWTMDHTYPHRMRLREPWRYDRQGAMVRCRRRFGYPGRIDDYERVWLVLQGVIGHAAVAVNGSPLGGGGPDRDLEFDITGLLRPQNEVALDIETTSGEAKYWEEVALEVRCLAWLKDVRVQVVNDDGKRLAVDGLVMGTAERLLELYVVLDRSPLLYATVQPRPDGEPFHLRSEVLEGNVAAKPVRVELVKGAIAWYTMDTVVAG